MRGMIWAVSMAAMMILAGCGKQAEQATVQADQQASSAPLPTPKPSYTNEDWKRDFTSTFEISKQKTNDDGITKYGACFESIDSKCKLYYSGMKDGFRKVDHLTPPATAFQEMVVKYDKNAGNAFVDMRVVAPQCKESVVVLSPKLFARTWLFMNKIAFMADGDVVYEKSAESQEVKRDTDDGSIEENWVFLLESADYSKLEKFASAKSKVIRISGEKGYITLSKKTVDVFAADIMPTIKVNQIINKSLSDGGGPICTS